MDAAIEIDALKRSSSVLYQAPCKSWDRVQPYYYDLNIDKFFSVL